MSSDKVNTAARDAEYHATGAFHEAATTAGAARAQADQEAWNAEEQAAQLGVASKAKAEEAARLRAEAKKLDAKQAELETRATTAGQQPGMVERVKVGLEHARDAVTGAFVTAKDSISHTAKGAQQSMAETSASAKEKVASGLSTLSGKAAESGAEMKKSADASHQTAAEVQAERREYDRDMELKAQKPPPEAPHMAPYPPSTASAPAGSGLKEKAAGVAESAAHWTADKAKQAEASAGGMRAEAQLDQGKLPHK